LQKSSEKYSFLSLNARDDARSRHLVRASHALEVPHRLNASIAVSPITKRIRRTGAHDESRLPRRTRAPILPGRHGEAGGGRRRRRLDPLYQIAAHAQSAGATPPGFPADVPLYKQAFQNWSGEVAVQDVWTAAPRSADDVVAIVNWARANGYRVRPRGYMHNWSPLTLDRAPAPPMSCCSTRRSR
jgi:hypothetical protein